MDDNDTRTTKSSILKTAGSLIFVFGEKMKSLKKFHRETNNSILLDKINFNKFLQRY